jgi:mono/diheme cytochrome c family protein
MLNFIAIFVMLLVAAFFFFLSFRSLRSRRAWIKWPGLLFSGLLGLLLLATSAVAVKGLYQLNYPPYTYTTVDFQVAGTPDQVAHGERLAYLCIDCHSSTGNLPLDGSKDNLAAGGPPIGVLYAPNLTPGGRLKDWSDAEILRAIREGVDNNDRPLLGMTSEPFSHFSDADAQALIAYLRAQPAVSRDLPERDLNILAALFVGAGLAPTSAQPPITAPIVAPPPGSPEYGRYLVYTAGCRDCHGPDLTGGTNPFIPIGPNLTIITPVLSEEQFLTFLHTGVNRTGRTVDPLLMPWKSYSQVYSDADLRDMYAYLQALPADDTMK